MDSTLPGLAQPGTCLASRIVGTIQVVGSIPRFRSVAVTMQHERRLSERKEPEQLIYVGLPSGNSAIVLNVSEGGFGFHAVALIEASAPVPFWFSVNSDRIDGTGELAWSDEGKKTGGLRITGLYLPQGPCGAVRA